MNASKDQETIRLNKFLAHSGLGDRRICDGYIKQGLISVNNTIITEPGTKVNLTDLVQFKGVTITPEKKVYILFNKPKNFSFEKNHKGMDILDLVQNFSKDLNLGYTPNIFSLDDFEIDDLGLMILTNDKELFDEYQSNETKIKSVYHIKLNKPIFEADLATLEKGFKTKFGNFKVEEIEILDDEHIEIGFATKSIKPNEISILFSILGFEVEKLDRTIVSNLTKRDLPRGKWRFLTPNELIKLKHLKY